MSETNRFEQPADLPDSGLFETCRRDSQKVLSDDFVDGVLGGELMVGGENESIKGYLDQVELTDSDREILADPQRFVGIYKTTAQMVQRNLKLIRRDDAYRPLPGHEGPDLGGAYNDWGSKVDQAADELLALCQGRAKFLSDAAQATGSYRNLLSIDGQWPMTSGQSEPQGIRPNIKIQLQGFAGSDIFVMAYTDVRVREKLYQEEKPLNRRIYLNPDMEAAPLIFEQLLKDANDSGISLQLKIYQRLNESYKSFRRCSANGEVSGGLRGDGVVIYVNDADADIVLDLVFAIRQSQPEAFAGRTTSRVPHELAEGIAIGDEPSHPSASGRSLTSHRAEIIQGAKGLVEESGYQGEEARRYFRYALDHNLRINGINPENIAFDSQPLAA